MDVIPERFTLDLLEIKPVPLEVVKNPAESSSDVSRNS
jgi:hypothetical protein